MWSMLAVRNGRDGLLGVDDAADEVDVGRVVGADGGRDGRVVEEPLADRQRVVRAGRHEHDVDQPLPRDLPHLLAVLLERLEPDLAGVQLGRLARARRCRSAMSASLASARMNSRQLGSAWIAASLRSSDLIISRPPRPLPWPRPEMVTRDPPAEVARSSRAHRHPHRPRGSRRSFEAGRAAGAGVGLAGRLGVALEDLVDRLAEHLGRVLQRRDFLGPELDLELGLDALAADDGRAPRGRRRACRRRR